MFRLPIIFVAALLVCVVAAAEAAGAPARETVSSIMARSRKPRTHRPHGRVTEEQMAHYRNGLRSPKNAPSVSGFPDASGVANLTSGSPFTLGTSFLAINLSEAPFVPPDTQFAVGPTQILAVANGRIKVFDRNGNVGALNVDTDVFFSSQTSNGTTDPRVRYDRLTGRWFVIMIDIPSPQKNNRILVAVSSSSNITDTTSFSFYSFQQNAASPTGDANRFADYPTLGIDRFALYIGCNMFGSSGFYAGTSGFVINKSNLLAGTLIVTAFRGLASASGAGPYSPQGVDNDDQNATQGYFIGVDNSQKSRLVLRRVSNPGGTPTISANIFLTVPTTVSPVGGVPSLGGSSLDDLDDRLFAATLKNGSLWTAHNIEVNASGVADSAGNRNGARWYEITNLAATPGLKQSGTVFSTNAVTPSSYWIPTIAMSGQGHALLGCSVAGANQHAEIAVTTRLVTDAAGAMSTPAVVQTSPFSYAQGGSPDRWGDYSRVLVDPRDDMTFWTAQEYASGTSTWGVRVIRLSAPPPAVPISCAPSTLVIGTTTNIAIAGSAAGGAGFFDPEASFPNHIGAMLGAGIIINSITFSNATNISVNLTVLSGSSTNSRFMTVTNPDGQFVTSASALVNLVQPNAPPTISSLTDQTLDEDTVLGPLAFTVSDAETPDPLLNVTASSSDTNIFPSGGIVLNNNGPNWSITLVPATNQSGVATVNIVATDAAGATATNTLTVFVAPVNDAPTITSVPPISIVQGATLLLSNSASDIEGDTVTFTLGIDAPTNMSIEGNTGVITWTPNMAQVPSTNVIAIIATDDGIPNMSTTNTFSIVVSKANSAPIIAAISNQVIHAGETVSLTVGAIDTDVPANVLTFTLEPGSPTNATVSTNGLFTWSTTAADAGIHAIGLRVTDDGTPALSDVTTFNITVVEVPTLTITLNETNVMLSWNSITGRTYRVQFRTDVTSGNWNDLDGDIPATNSTAEKSDAISDEQRFYRVKLLP